MVGQRSWEQYKQGNPPHYSYSQRYESYGAVLHERGLEEIPIKGYGVPQLTAQMKKHQLTAIVTMSTASVPYVRLAAHKLGWSVPQDLSVAVCDFEERVRQSRQCQVRWGILRRRHDQSRTGSMNGRDVTKM